MKRFNKEEAQKIGNKLKIDWNDYSIDQFRRGLNVEMEHADVTKGDPIKTGKIALAHLKEDPGYYTKLEKMERSFSKKKRYSKK